MLLQTNYDYDGIAGKLHSYGVSAIGPDWGESLPAYSLGWQPANGKLGGTVKTPYGGIVDSVAIEIKTTHGSIGSCLEFKGSNDYVITNPYNNFPDKALTISFWIKTDQTGSTHPFSYATSTATNAVLIGQPSNLFIYIGNTQSGPTGVSFNDNAWHHLALTWQSGGGEFNIFKDGKIVFTGLIQDGYTIPGDGSLVFGQDQDAVGGGFDPNQAFGGLLDEVRIWDHVRNPNDIQTDMYRRLKGDEQHLISYWSFDDQSGRAPQGIAGDYAKNSGNHGNIYGPLYSSEISPVQSKILTDNRGSYTYDNIYYGEETQFGLTPSKAGHKFDPDNLSIVMSTNAPEHTAIDFIDTTALTITGRIELSGTNCPVPNVEILLDDQETGVYTDAAGEFQLTIEQPNIYNIKPVLGESDFAHTFDPPTMNIDVKENVLGLKFKDTTFRLLNGKFGAPCAGDIGSAEIVITSIGDDSGCFEKTVWTDANGNYSILLPAQSYTVDIKDVNINDRNPNNDIVLQYFTTDTVDLTWTGKEHNFTYRNEPIIRITGWPQFGGGNYKVPILDQGNIYTLIIEVLDVWGEDTCRVNQGTVTISDYISGIGDEPITAILDSGRAVYRCIPLEPSYIQVGFRSEQQSLGKGQPGS